MYLAIFWVSILAFPYFADVPSFVVPFFVAFLVRPYFRVLGPVYAALGF